MKIFNQTQLQRAGSVSSGLLLLVLAAGCATKPKVQPVHVFFPPAPDEPRIQYLTSFGSEADLGAHSKFFKFVVGEDQTIQRPIWKPYGITTSPGFIHICDTMAANVAMVDIAQKRLRYLKPGGEAALVLPINIAVDEDGTRYVTDTKREQVLIYDRKGSFLGAMGKKGESKPCGIAITKERLYVSDLKHACVRVYDKANRALLFSIPREGAGEKAKLFSPTNLAIDQQGHVYVTDTGGFTVQIYDADGNHLRGLGELGIEPGRFNLPKGLGVDRDGRVYVVDAATTVVQLFDHEGRLLMYFGEPKTSGPGSLYLPAGLAIDYENTKYFDSLVAPGYRIEYLILVTNQAGPRKVSIYAFLRKS